MTTMIRLKAVLHDDGANWVTNGKCDMYFKEGSALEGVKAIITAGNVSINGFPIPASADELGDGYTVNGVVWLSAVEGGWAVKKGFRSTVFESYDDAAVAVLRAVRAGQESVLYDTDGDGYADRIEANNVAAFIVGQIIDNGNGTCNVVREEYAAPPETGKLFDGMLFTGSGEVVVKLGPALRAGDMALAWLSPEGWVLDKAAEAKGILVYGEDHKYYQINNVKYEDAMMFSRDNIVISNRCGELANAHKYFGFMNNGEGWKVSLWTVPTVDPNHLGAPAGFTTGEYAGTYLSRAIAFARAKLDAIDASAKADEKVQTACAQVSAAIAAAQEALKTDGIYSSLLDYQTYLLYLNLHGLQDDIGARFSHAYDDIIGLENALNGLN